MWLLHSITEIDTNRIAVACLHPVSSVNIRDDVYSALILTLQMNLSMAWATSNKLLLNLHRILKPNMYYLNLLLMNIFIHHATRIIIPRMSSLKLDQC